MKLEISKLKQERDELKLSIKNLKEKERQIIYGGKNIKSGSRLNRNYLEQIKKGSIINLSLVFLKRLTNFDLMNIILAREKCLLDKINEFDKSLKHNDREVFKTLRKENNELTEYLIFKDQSYKDLLNAKNQLKRDKKQINLLRLKLRKYEEV